MSLNREEKYRLCKHFIRKRRKSSKLGNIEAQMMRDLSYQTVELLVVA